MTAYSGFVVPERDARRHVAAELAWLSNGVVIGSQLGTTETTAIVHPRAFTTAMMSAAQSHGAEVRWGRITGIIRRADGSTVEGVEVDGSVIEADAVVVRWSRTVAETSQPLVGPSCAHVRPVRGLGAHGVCGRACSCWKTPVSAQAASASVIRYGRQRANHLLKRRAAIRAVAGREPLNDVNALSCAV
jgi:hypothetical protein